MTTNRLKVAQIAKDGNRLKSPKSLIILLLVIAICCQVKAPSGLITRWSLVQVQLAPLFFFDFIRLNLRLLKT